MRLFHHALWIYYQYFCKFRGGNTLLLMIGVNCFEKSLRSFAFSQQFNKNILFTRRGGILDALHLFITRFIIFQYDF